MLPVQVVQTLLQKQTVVLTMVQRLISVTVPSTLKLEQGNYLPYGTIQSLRLNSALFTMRVS